MILYCDTSAFVKRYVREDGSDDITTQSVTISTIHTAKGVPAVHPAAVWQLREQG